MSIGLSALKKVLKYAEDHPDKIKELLDISESSEEDAPFTVTIEVDHESPSESSSGWSSSSSSSGFEVGETVDELIEKLQTIQLDRNDFDEANLGKSIDSCMSKYNSWKESNPQVAEFKRKMKRMLNSAEYYREHAKHLPEYVRYKKSLEVKKMFQNERNMCAVIDIFILQVEGFINGRGYSYEDFLKMKQSHEMMLATGNLFFRKKSNQSLEMHE